MMNETSRVGRPPVENPLTEAERSKRYRKKKSQTEKATPFWLSVDDQENLRELMAKTGFTPKEKSEFLSTLLLLLSNKQYLGDASKFKALFNECGKS